MLKKQNPRRGVVVPKLPMTSILSIWEFRHLAQGYLGGAENIPAPLQPPTRGCLRVKTWF